MSGFLVIIVLAVIGLLLGLFLAISSVVFHVEKPEQLEKVEDLLPGANCGACGYPGCVGLAAAIYSGEAEPASCPVASDSQVEEIAKVMGKEVTTDGLRDIAYIKCQGMNDKDIAKKFEYIGIESCEMASLTAGGWKSCEYGCLKLGDCIKVCKFDALSYGENHEPIIDKDKCTSCGLCVTACPRQLIEIIPYKRTYMVTCSSKDKGALTRKNCKVGCIACKLCEKACKFDAVKVVDNIAYIDQDKCVGCGLCAKACPQNVIEFIDGPRKKKKPVVKKPEAGCGSCTVCK